MHKFVAFFHWIIFFSLINKLFLINKFSLINKKTHELVLFAIAEFGSFSIPLQKESGGFNVKNSPRQFFIKDDTSEAVR